MTLPYEVKSRETCVSSDVEASIRGTLVGHYRRWRTSYEYSFHFDQSPSCFSYVISFSQSTVRQYERILSIYASLINIKRPFGARVRVI